MAMPLASCDLDMKPESSTPIQRDRDLLNWRAKLQKTFESCKYPALLPSEFSKKSDKIQRNKWRLGGW